MSKSDKNKSREPLIITRVFDAPKERVWQAWTDPKISKKWWGPQGFTCPVSEIDFRVGGKYLLAMRDPDGNDYWSTGTYREIVPLEKIVATDSFADENGNVVPSTHYGMEGLPLELEVTVALESIDSNKTRMTLTHVGFPEGEIREQAGAGWNQSFDKMAEIFK